MGEDRPDAQAGRLLEGLLAQHAISLDDAMARAAQRLAEVLGADKVDVLLHDEATDALVAVGTSQTPMGRLEHEADDPEAERRAWAAILSARC